MTRQHRSANHETTPIVGAILWRAAVATGIGGIRPDVTCGPCYRSVIGSAAEAAELRPMVSEGHSPKCRSGRGFDCRIDRREERGFSKRLQQIGGGAGGNAPLPGAGFVMGRDYDSRNLIPVRARCCWSSSPVMFGICRSTIRHSGRPAARPERRSRAELKPSTSYGRCLKQPHQGLPDGRIVIYDGNSAVRFAHPGNSHENAARGSRVAARL